MAFTDPGAVLDAVYPAQPLLVAQIRRDVSNIASVFGADEAALLRINLAVSEAATNAILHAYRDRGAAGDVHVVVQHEDHTLDVSVCDDGIGMSPRTDSPGLGLGLGLIAHETSRCEISCRPDGGTQVAMRFILG